MKALGLLVGLGVLLIVLAANTDWAFDHFDENGFVALAMPMGLVAFVSVPVAKRAPAGAALLVILFVGFILRLIAFSSEPLLSSDIFRYVWDGRVAHAGINPYRFIPADPALAMLRDAHVYPEINRADYAHTAYPPVAQMFFYLATSLGSTLDHMRLAFEATEIVSIAGLLWILRRLQLPLVLVAGYVWHPLAIWETANAGHVDALLTMAVVLALVTIVAHRQLLGVLLVSASVLVKPYAIAMLPAFWRPWGIVGPVLSVALVGLAYLPYLGVGEGVLGFVPTYLNEEGFVGGNGFWLVSLVRRVAGALPYDVEIYLALGALILAAAVLRILARPAYYAPQAQVRDIGTLLFIGLFILSPNYPWYYLPLVPFVALEGSLTMWAVTVLAIGLHAWWPTPDDHPTRFLFWKSILNLGWMLAFVIDRWRARRPDPAATGAVASPTLPLPSGANR